MAVYGQEIASSHRWHNWNQPNSTHCSPEGRSPALFLNSFGIVNSAVLGAYTSLARALGSVLYSWVGQGEFLLLVTGLLAPFPSLTTLGMASVTCSLPREGF